MSSNLSVAVIGGGSFGTALANLIAQNGHEVVLWMRDPEQAEAVRRYRHNPRYLKDLEIHGGVQPSTDLSAALNNSELVFVVLPSSALRKVLQPVAALLAGKILISTTKGIEADSFMLMSQIIKEIAPKARIGVISGPNLAAEIAAGAPTATVVASEDEALCLRVQEVLHGPSFRVYASRDRVGAELAGALKNVYAIMAGMAAALNLGENTKAALITRGLAEMTRFALTQGAKPATFFGLAGVGDLIVTCSSSKSRNFQVGYALGQGHSLEEAVNRLGEVAEGVNTLRVLKSKAEQSQVYMPLVAGLYEILFNGRTLGQVLETLMGTEPKEELDFF